MEHMEFSLFMILQIERVLMLSKCGWGKLRNMLNQMLFVFWLEIKKIWKIRELSLRKRGKNWLSFMELIFWKPLLEILLILMKVFLVYLNRLLEN
jgi:hypothetical protein